MANYHRIFVINAADAAAINASLEAEGFGPNVFISNAIPVNGKRSDAATKAYCDGQFEPHQLPIIQGLVTKANGNEFVTKDIKSRGQGEKLKDTLSTLGVKTRA